MIKHLKTSLTILLVLLLFSSPIKAYSKTDSDVVLKQNAPNVYAEPKQFRKSTDELKPNKNINLSGLNTLNISGSKQFSEKGLEYIVNSIGNKMPITVIDLREESHGFINGIGVSWENKLNNANKDLTLEEIIKNENQRLNSIPLNKTLTFSNTKTTIIPKKVEDELKLTKSQNLSYLRIPVTDGTIPNEDMVNYFVNFVKTLPKNTWLHFHCKEGLGRTTTFMIMYDIMKNCQSVSLTDIIERQLILGKLSEKNIESFKNPSRLKFLNDFYEKCKKGEYVATSSSLDKVAFNNSSSYIKNTVIPKKLYVISEDKMTKEERVMISTLQGVISNKSENQIYILDPAKPDYNVWLNDLKENYNTDYKYVNNPWTLLDNFKSHLKGYVTYSGFDNPSINNACSIASLKEAIVIDKTLEPKIKKYGISNLIKDCTGTDKHWAFNNLWNKGLNHSTVIQLSPNHTTALRDYAIMSKSLVFYEDSVNDFLLREKVFSAMKGNAKCLGWGPDEHNNVSIASRFGVDIIAADWSNNLSVFSAYPSTPKAQADYKPILNKNTHYVTFIMSDGDNQQWFLGTNFTSKKWYGSSYKDNFSLGWSISPSLYYLAPTVFNKYYKTSSELNYNNNFLVSPSGNGYIYPSKFPITKLDNYTKNLSDYMKQVDQNYVTILDDDSFYKTNLWHQYTKRPNISGLFYLNYKKHDDYKGKIIWSNNKPIVSCRDLLWNGLQDENQLIKTINTRVEKGYTNIKDPNSYTFVYVHVWSKTMDNVQYVINELSKNPKVQVVSPDNFMELIQNNVSKR